MQGKNTTVRIQMYIQADQSDQHGKDLAYGETENRSIDGGSTTFCQIGSGDEKDAADSCKLL